MGDLLKFALLVYHTYSTALSRISLKYSYYTDSAPYSTVAFELSYCTVLGTSVDSWGLTLNFSKPTQELSEWFPICVVPSTVVNSTLLISSEYCQNYANGTAAQCESLSGNTFNISTSEASYNTSTRNAVLGSNSVWSKINSQALVTGNTSLFLPPDNTIPSYPVGIITSGNNQNAGHLGLATDSQLLRAAIDNGLITQNGFGLGAGSQSVANPRDGKLVLGGYDQASINGPFSNFSIGDTSASEEVCLLQVTITQLTLRFPLSEGSFSDFNITEAGIDIPACVEP
jgi:hypothetical protein